MADEYLSTDPNAGLPAGGGYLSTDPHAGTPIKAPEESTRLLREATGPYEAGAAMLSGMVAKPVSDIAGLAATGSEIVSPKGGDPAKFKKAVQDALTYAPRSKTGQILSEYNPLALLARGVDWLGEKSGEFIGGGAAADTLRGAAGNVVGEAVRQAPGLLGAKFGGEGMPLKRAPDPKAVAAHAQGLRLTPSEANAGPIAKGVEGLAGEPKLAKEISKANVEVYNEKIAKDLGLPKDTPLNNETLTNLEKQHWKNYDNIRGIGTVEADATFNSTLDNLLAKYKSPENASFAKTGKALGFDEIRKFVEDFKSEAKSFDASEGVDVIRGLREKSKESYANGRGAEAKIYRGTADALEEQLARNVEGSNLDPNIVKNFRESRKQLAKIHDARKALGGGENIDPNVYAKIQKKSPNLLTGGAKEIAEFNIKNPRSAQKLYTGSINAPTWSDIVLMGFNAAKGVAMETMLLGARPIAREVLASRPYQALQASQPRVPAAVLRGGGAALSNIDPQTQQPWNIGVP